MFPFTPKDTIALVVILGLIILKLTDHNGSLDVAVALILGYYFAHRRNGTDPGR